ncbi:MAG: hypothetical protein EBR54_02115 [Flavobacteriia bacterium]|nr:hypothetical protein [Flavobacteriia bacterium]
MNEMDWIFKKTSYSALSTSEKEALADLCNDEASFARLKGLLELSEQSLPEPPPAHIRTNLDALFDATYTKPAPQKQVKRFRLTYIILAAAAVIGVIFLLFPWTTNRGNGNNSPKVAKGPQTPKNEQTEIVSKFRGRCITSFASNGGGYGRFRKKGFSEGRNQTSSHFIQGKCAEFGSNICGSI